MGEVVDLTQFGDIEEASKKEISKAVIDNAAGLLGSGKKRETIKAMLKEQGYSFGDSEKIVSRAEARLYAKPKQEINFPQLFLMIVAVLAALSVVAFLAFQLTGGPADCGDDTFCVQKTLECAAGKYTSSYRGMAYSYEITDQGIYCQVFVKATASANPEISPGMTMNCLYTITGGQSQLATGKCDGLLAGPLGL
ncbi:hypothetical protein ACFLQ2_01860 [archaeon]